MQSIFFKITLSILKDVDLVDEAISDTFLKIVENAEKISSLPYPQALPSCVNIIKHKAINLIQKDQKYVYTDNLGYYGNIILINYFGNKMELNVISLEI